MTNQLEFVRVKNFIDGEWVAESGAEYVPLFNPSTGEQIGEVPLSSKETSQAAVNSAHKAYDSWRRLPTSKRVNYLFRLRSAMEEHAEELAFSIAIDQAKHISEARGEVSRVLEIIETACGIPTLIQGETLEGVGSNITARVIRQPLGVFGGIAPFNFPALVFGWFVPFAIGAGNTFLFKPSPESPFFMQKMGDILNEIGLPRGVVNIVNGDHAVPEGWYDHPKIAGVCLVGSTPTAKKVAERCGKAGKRSMLLGGAKNYLVAMEDAQMDVFIENYLNSCYGSAGQRCLAGSIVAAVPAIHDRLVERIVEASKKVTVGDAMDPGVYMGPVISAQAKKRVEHYIEIGINEGANLVLDGRNPRVPEKNKNGYFVGPTVFTDVTPDMTIAKEEIFGPVVSVMKIRDIDVALELIRNQENGNGACLFTQNLYYTEKFISEANVGMVGINVGICAPHPYVPFGGIKDSLLGTNKVQGKGGIDFFTQDKIATIRFSSPSGAFLDRGEGEKEGGKVAEPQAVRSCVGR
ncbi:MAG: CoA-acylating methylmalonate-semialdehyde dehydrogenase [Candidatus Methylomirabilota bacterium]|jgi:malonate-semialdehyde dehydrogenase (acetylating)/methylmalonate-semialdehyde dehydrogenase